MVSPHHCRRGTLGIARLSIAAHGVGSQRRHMYARRRRRCRRRSRYARACAFFLPHPPLATCLFSFCLTSLCTSLHTRSLTQAKLRKDMQSSDPAQQNGDLRSAWTKTEDEIILSSVNEFGPKWVEIAGRLPGRTEHAARNRYHRLVSRGAANDPP